MRCVCTCCECARAVRSALCAAFSVSNLVEVLVLHDPTPMFSNVFFNVQLKMLISHHLGIRKTYYAFSLVWLAFA